MNKTLREKISLLTLGSIVSAMMALAGVLVSSFFGSYVSKADYNGDMIEIKTNVKFIKENIKEIKEIVKEGAKWK